MNNNTSTSGKRQNVFRLAIKHFPTGLIATAIGIAFLSAPLFYNFFRENGINSLVIRIVLTGAIVGIIPIGFLYLVSLFRAPRIQTKIETAAQEELEVMSHEMEALQEKEKREEEQVHRLEEVVQSDIKVRQELEEKEDERWQALNEQLQLQKETAALASQETVIVAKQVKDIKDEAEVALKEYAKEDVEARQSKEKTDESHWESLEALLGLQEEQNIERDKQQVLRDEEHSRVLAAIGKDNIPQK